MEAIVIWARKSPFYGNIRHLAKIIPVFMETIVICTRHSPLYGNNRHLAKITPVFTEVEINYCVLEHLPIMSWEYLNLLPLPVSIIYGK